MHQSTSRTGTGQAEQSFACPPFVPTEEESGIDPLLVSRHIKDRNPDDDCFVYTEPSPDPRKNLDNLLPTHPRFSAGLKVMRRDIKVERSFADSLERVGGGIRSTITKLSRGSRKRMIETARNMPVMRWFITLTYGEYLTDGRAIKRHMRLIRQVLQRRGIKGFWWLEFQGRGAPHYHLVCDQPITTNEITRHWQRIIGLAPCEHCQRIERAKTWRPGGPTSYVACPDHCEYSKTNNSSCSVEWFNHAHAQASYVAKESSKMQQKEVPEDYESVGRFWGYWGFTISAVLQIAGSISALAPLLRIIRRLNDEVTGRRKRDKGRYSYTAWDIGPTLIKYGDRIRIDGRYLSDLITVE